MRLGRQTASNGFNDALANRGLRIPAAVTLIGILSAGALLLETLPKSASKIPLLAAAGIVTNSCIEQITEPNGQKKEVGADVEVIESNGSPEVTDEQPDQNEPPGTCDTTFTGPNGAVEGQASIPSSELQSQNAVNQIGSQLTPDPNAPSPATQSGVGISPQNAVNWSPSLPSLPLTNNPNEATFGAPPAGQIGEQYSLIVSAPASPMDSNLIQPEDTGKAGPDITNYPANPNIPSPGVGYGSFTPQDLQYNAVVPAAIGADQPYVPDFTSVERNITGGNTFGGPSSGIVGNGFSPLAPDVTSLSGIANPGNTFSEEYSMGNYTALYPPIDQSTQSDLQDRLDDLATAYLLDRRGESLSPSQMSIAQFIEPIINFPTALVNGFNYLWNTWFPSELSQQAGP